MAITKINKLPDDVVSTAKVADNTVINADVNTCAAIVQSKVSGLATSLSNLCSAVTTATADNSKNNFNIALLGFKMATQENLTVFNLVDGVVDEFHDESGTDEAEGSNDLYCGTSDFYTNLALACAPFTAGFTTTSVTNSCNSTAGTNPQIGDGTFGVFTVPSGTTSISAKLWGSGGGSTYEGDGGGGGFSSGCLAVTAAQTISVVVGEGGSRSTCGVLDTPNLRVRGGLGGGGPGSSGGGGLTGLFVTPATSEPALTSAPQAYIVAGSGGGGGYRGPCFQEAQPAGAGGGLIGDAGTTQTEQTSFYAPAGGGGGGDQEQGGSVYPNPNGPSYTGVAGSLFTGGAGAPPSGDATYTPGGGSGFYGGGAGPLKQPSPVGSAAGGGSSYYSHPQITCGSTEEGAGTEGGGVADPQYVSGTNEADVYTPGAEGTYPDMPRPHGQDGYVLLSGVGSSLQTSSTTIISNAFASGTVPTSSRIVVFEENVDTPTLNTDIIASVSRDGTNFTNATLSDSGYVTGSSGQRVLTGQVDISGQPSGQSMRWKLALANNQVKIHGVSLSWA